MLSKSLQELITPALDDKVLVNIVRRKTGWKDITLKNVLLDGCEAKKGESYLSTVMRFKIDASGKKEGDTNEESEIIPVIVKVIPKNIARKKTFRSEDFFPNEINFYEKVWSKLREFVKSKNLDTPLEDILPLCLATHTDGDNDFVALEDLGFKGFEGIDRSVSLNLEHTRLIMRTFATFHAISFAFKHQHPEEFKHLVSSVTETYFHEKFRNWYVRFQKNLLEIIKDCVVKQLPEKYVKKMDEIIASDFFKTLSDQCAKVTPYSVISHGDAWVPNFLVKYDKDKNPIQPMMIDFQLARYASLGLDLTFFIYTCTEQDIREQYYDSLIEEYYKEFVSVLEKLGSDPKLITLEAIKKELKDAGSFGIGMSMEGLVMSLIDEEDVADIDTLQGTEAVPLEDVWILKPFTSEEKRQRIADIIKYSVDHGFI